jgi:hypothetical protein
VYTAKATAIAHPKVINSQSPLPRRAVDLLMVRPDPIRAHSIATHPSPKQIRMKQPKNSAHNSPTMPCFHLSGKGPTALDSATVDTQPPPRRLVQELAPRICGVAATDV